MHASHPIHTQTHKLLLRNNSAKQKPETDDNEEKQESQLATFKYIVTGSRVSPASSSIKVFILNLNY